MGDRMITKGGRLWEIINSWWILFTFTLIFFNWVAFLYIGIRVRKLKWSLWGILYFLPFGTMLLGLLKIKTYNLIFLLIMIISSISAIIHAFIVRKEYLIRLDLLKQSNSKNEEIEKLRNKALKELKIENNHDAEIEDKVSNQTEKVASNSQNNKGTIISNAFEVDNFQKKSCDYLNKINLHIKCGCFAGIAEGLIILALLLATGAYFLLYQVFLVFGLSYGVYRKSRVCAILLFTGFLADRIKSLLKLNNLHFIGWCGVILGIITLGSFFIQGIYGTFAYHRLNGTLKNTNV